MQNSVQNQKIGRRDGEAGYTLLMAVFMVATVIVLTSAVATNILTEGRRQREAEMAWRGEQYQRAIGLYFRKFGKYPTKIDDLVKATNGVRFLREAYKDPMNKEDGSWRFIYVGPNGQLIGSVKSTSLLQNMLTASSSGLPGGSIFGGGSGSPAAPTTGATAAAGTGAGATGTGAPGAAGAAGAATPGQSSGQSGFSLSANPLESQPQPMTGDVIGGNIIGIGSKVKEKSLRVYQGGDSYDKWEFIWNPMQQVAIPGQQPAVNPAANAGAVPGAGQQLPQNLQTIPGSLPPANVPNTTTTPQQ